MSTAEIPGDLVYQPTVAILMCTLQGEKFLQEQLASFNYQTHANWVLWVSDDGSTDSTIDILKEYKSYNAPGKVHIIHKNGNNFVENFLSLVCNPEIVADYYAFSDQDDIWMDEKLEKALAKLLSFKKTIPSLYFSRTEYINENNRKLGNSFPFTRLPCFENALLQNIGGGNTMVFNQATKDLLSSFGYTTTPTSHDWWAYILVTGCDGSIVFDPMPSVKYRQHAKNLVGSNRGLASKSKRILKIFQGSYRSWLHQNNIMVKQFGSCLSARNSVIFENYQKSLSFFFPVNVYYLIKSGVFRQTRKGTLVFFLAFILGLV